MQPCTRRIAPAEKIIKATSLDDLLVEHAPWCRTAPHAPLLHIKPLKTRPGKLRASLERDLGHDPRAAVCGAVHGERAVERCDPVAQPAQAGAGGGIGAAAAVVDDRHDHALLVSHDRD